MLDGNFECSQTLTDQHFQTSANIAKHNVKTHPTMLHGRCWTHLEQRIGAA
jgi:hypothetical protein